jgi:hypothetical protein
MEENTCENCIYWEGWNCLNRISDWRGELVMEDHTCDAWEGDELYDHVNGSPCGVLEV